ncbi:hypothetical protein PT931_00105 [Longispora urticae]
MAPRLRVLHLPARTPYVWKLRGPDFDIINGTKIKDGVEVPAAVGAEWVLRNRPLNWLDVLHLHHIEFEDLAALERLLDACGADGVRVVFTAHDLTPMFGENGELLEKLRLFEAAGVSWICLTPGSADAIAKLVAEPAPVAVIPHGYVAAPDALAGRERIPAARANRYLMFGATRPNRDQISTVVNWSLGTEAPDARLDLLLRAFSPVDFSHPASRVPQLLDAVRADPRIQVTMRPYPTDAEVINAGLGADALLLPYLWGTHSGQLELAFDLNLLPICASTGYFQQQYERHKGLVPEPEWFDWSEGHPYLFGERFLTALDRAAELLSSGTRQLDPAFLEYRREEHRQILNAHARVYGGHR